MYDKLAATQKNLAEVDQMVNQTGETLRKVDELPGTTQEQIELSHSRTLQYLQNEESRRASLMNQVLESKMQFDSLENTKILMRSGEPIYPVWPPKALIVAVVGMLGLMIGIFAAFLREGLGRKVEYSAEPNE